MLNATAEIDPEPPLILQLLNDLSTTALVWLLEVGQNLLQVLLILVVSVAIGFLLRFVIRRVVHRIVDSAKSKANVDDTQALERSPLADMRLVQRTRTLGTILQNIVNVTVGIVALVMIVNVLAPDLVGSLTLLTAAIGAGLGFGAQNIVKDVLNGLFIVAEDQIGIGDMVDMGLASGVVEYVAVRITHVRDVNGTLWYVRNGEVTRIGNMSQGWARAIIDVGVPVDADVPAVESALLDAALGLAKEPKWRTRIIERPEVWGLESMSGDALVVRVVMKTRAAAMDDVAQELRLRLKDAMQELPLEDVSFDLVAMMQAITYADRPAQAVAEAARVLRPGGRLLLTSLAKHEHRSIVESYGHVNLGFTARELRRFVDRAGLKLQHIETVTREKRPPHFEVISLIAERPGK